MDDTAQTYIRDYLNRSAHVLQEAMRDRRFEETVARIADAALLALRGGGKLLIAGNGGSAADAQHLAGEFLSRFRADRAPLAAIALTTDTSVLTAVGNDYGYQYVFERQVRGLGRPSDLFLGISTSGRSSNVLLALRAARDIGMTTVGFTGSNGGEMLDLCDLLLAAPSEETPIIQQIHIVAGHMICGLVEEAWIAAARA